WIHCCFVSSRRRHTRLQGDWSSDVCSSDLDAGRFDAAERELHTAEGLGGDAYAQAEVDREWSNLSRARGDSASELNYTELAVRRSEERRVGKGGRGGWRAAGERKSVHTNRG